MPERSRICLFTLFLLLIVFVTSAHSAEWTWEDLVAAYGRDEVHQEAAVRLRQDLLGDVSPGAGEKEQWESLRVREGTSRSRAVLALGLVERMFPAGNVSRWEEVQGFWRPAEIPRSLAALDAVFVATLSLLEMNEPGARTLALGLMRDLSRSSRARYHALLHAPQEYGEILEMMGRVTPPLPFGVMTGSLPLARSVRGWISQETALNRGATFLDNFGGVARGGGIYAWDRERGRIYRVREENPRYRWIIGH